MIPYTNILNCLQKVSETLTKKQTSREFNIYNKKDFSPVTDMDLYANEEIIKILQETNIPIISEEMPLSPYTIRKNWEKVWIIDTLDGTTNYIEGLQDFCINIALVIDNKPEIGFIALPHQKTIYWNRNDEQIYKSVWEDQKSIYTIPFNPFKAQEKSSINLVQSYHSTTPSIIQKKLESEFVINQVIKMGAALKYTALLEERADLFARSGNIMEWDTAAGFALMKVRNIKVSSYKTFKPFLFNTESLIISNFICYNPEIIKW